MLWSFFLRNSIYVHMSCTIPVALANVMAVYLLASLFYLIITLGSGSRPFHKSLTRRQKLILQKSKRKRRNIFLLGCVLACVVLFYFSPFKGCRCMKSHNLLPGQFPTLSHGGAFHPSQPGSHPTRYEQLPNHLQMIPRTGGGMVRFHPPSR